MEENTDNTPQLRFPEFKERWKKRLLGDVSTFSKGKGISKSDIVLDGRTPCIRYGELYTEYGTVIIDVASRTNTPIVDLVLSNGGEVIVPASGETAIDIATASLVQQRGVALGSDLNIIRSTLDGNFLALYISGKKRIALAEVAQGNSVVHLYPAQLSKLKISVPSLPEQKKIASVLSAVEIHLEALGKKLNLLSDYKRGIVQQIFAQEIRFKRGDRSDFPNWEETRLGDIADPDIKYSFTGGPFGSDLKQSHYTEDGVMIIQLQNIGDGQFIDKAKRIIFTSEKDADRLRSSNIYPNEILISKMGDPVARSCLVPEHFERYVMCSDGIRFVVNERKYSKNFVFQALNTRTFREKALQASIGSTRKRISLGDLKALTIPTPHHEEQLKIAGFLSAIDDKINVVAKQIALTETLKMGLMQKMFV